MRKFLFYIFIFSVNFCFAQTLEGSLFKGAMISHTPKLNHLLPTVVEGVSVSGEKLFESSTMKNKPIVGLTFRYTDYNNDILGQTVGLHAYEGFFLNKKRSLQFKIGTGLGFQTRPYHAENNRFNNVFGSVLTFNMHVGLMCKLLTVKNFELKSHLMLEHYSNGAYKLPNLGLNYMSVGFSLGYHKAKERQDEELFKHDKVGQLVYRATAYSGMHETFYKRNKPRPFYNLGLSVEKPVTKSVLLGLTVDYYHSRSLKYELSVLGQKDYHRLSMGGIFRLKQGRLSSLIQLGHYLYSGDFFVSQVYFRLQTMYDITEKVFVTIGVKTHRFDAEAFELGLGLKLKR